MKRISLFALGLLALGCHMHDEHSWQVGVPLFPKVLTGKADIDITVKSPLLESFLGEDTSGSEPENSDG